MRAVRLWSVRNARMLEAAYAVFQRVLFLARPVVRLIGRRPLEAPVALIERNLKGFLFDCQMCGMCALSHTGMSCPMNCPKNLRNGPCGGVRPNGNCEVEPDMPCVWVQAWEGARRMSDPDAILALQRPVNHALRGSSSWLRVVEHGDSGTRWSEEKP